MFSAESQIPLASGQQPSTGVVYAGAGGLQMAQELFECFRDDRANYLLRASEMPVDRLRGDADPPRDRAQGHLFGRARLFDQLASGRDDLRA